jgi:hypothetical protein
MSNETPLKKPRIENSSEERRKRYRTIQCLYKNAVKRTGDPALYVTLQGLSGDEKLSRLREYAASKPASKPLFVSKRTLKRGTPIHPIPGDMIEEMILSYIPNNARPAGGARRKTHKKRLMHH